MTEQQDFYLKRSKEQEARTPNERFGASGAVARPKVCANLQVLRPSEPYRSPA